MSRSLRGRSASRNPYHSRRHRPHSLDEPVAALERGPAGRSTRSRPVGRAAQQVALAGPDPERAHELELRGRLDPLGDDQRAPAVGQVAQGLDDLERRVADGPALDEREVDLDDVEAELAEQPQAGVAGPDVVGGEADARDPARVAGAAQAIDVLDGLALGQLDDDPFRGSRPWRTIIRRSAWTLKSSLSSVRGDRLRVSDSGQAQAGPRSP